MKRNKNNSQFFTKIFFSLNNVLYICSVINNKKYIIMTTSKQITEIIQNVKTGDLYIVTINNNRKRALYKDEYSYYLKSSKGIDRLENKEDIKRIENYL